MWQAYGQRLRETASAWHQDNAFRMAAALAYYSVFSLVPLVLLGIGVIGAVFGERLTQEQLLRPLRDLFGEEPSRAVEVVFRNAVETRSNSLFTVVGLGLLVVGACWVLLELQGVLNTIWQHPPRPRRNLLGRVLAWLGSLAAVLGSGLLLLAMLLATMLLSLEAHN